MRSFSMGISRRFAIACVLAALVACDDPLAPFQPEVTSAPDNFQAQATGLSKVSATRTYTWSNGGTRATVNHSTTTSGGATRLVIRDAAGTVVYDHALVPSLNEPTAVGTAGAWTIELRLTDYTGTVNFRAQKL
jgi:hypothetical protein